MPPTDRLFRCAVLAGAMSDLPFPEFGFCIFPGHAKRRGPLGEKAVAALYGEIEGEAFLVWEFCGEAKAAAYMEAPRRVPSGGLADTRLIRPISSEPSMEKNPRPL